MNEWMLEFAFSPSASIPTEPHLRKGAKGVTGWDEDLQFLVLCRGSDRQQKENGDDEVDVFFMERLGGKWLKTMFAVTRDELNSLKIRRASLGDAFPVGGAGVPSIADALCGC